MEILFFIWGLLHTLLPAFNHRIPKSDAFVKPLFKVDFKDADVCGIAQIHNISKSELLTASHHPHPSGFSPTFSNDRKQSPLLSTHFSQKRRGHASFLSSITNPHIQSISKSLLLCLQNRSPTYLLSPSPAHKCLLLIGTVATASPNWHLCLGSSPIHSWPRR